MRTRGLFVLFVLLGWCSMVLSQEVIIKGEVRGDTEGYNRVYVMDGKAGRDSAVIVDGLFELRLPYKAGMEPYLFLEAYMRPGRMQEPFPLVIEQPGTLHIRNVDLSKALHYARMDGMKAMVDYQVFLDGYFLLKDSLMSLQLERAAFNKQFGEGILPHLHAYMEQHKSSYATVYVLDKIKTLIEIDALKPLYDQLTVAQRSSEKGQGVSSYIDNVIFSAVGSDISALTYTDQTGRVVSLDALKGKFVLIDFWASWCGPCIKAFPHLRTVYDKYKGSNFEVLGISIDKKHAEWVKAYTNYKLPWLNGIDSSEDMQKRLLVTAVPTLFLIDPDGKIVLKQVGLGDTMDKVLEENLTKGSLTP